MIADENGLSEETRHVRCPRDPKRGCVWRISDEDRSDDLDHLLYSQAGRSEQLSSTTSGKRKQAKIPLGPQSIIATPTAKLLPSQVVTPRPQLGPLRPSAFQDSMPLYITVLTIHHAPENVP